MVNHGKRRQHLFWLLLVAALILAGCQSFKQKFNDMLAHWHMLGQDALEDPIKAVGGDGVLFPPGEESKPRSRKQLASATPEALISYYSPVFLQQRVDTKGLKYPYPPEFDMIGEARLRRESNGALKSYVDGPPKVYAIYKKLPIDGESHVQLTYTAWYPAHPRMKMVDLEAASIDSCVVRITLDLDHCPLFYETIAACGCFHKVFVEGWVEAAAKETYGGVEKGKKYCVEKVVKDSIDWEVGGAVEGSKDHPSRPLVFIKAGDHKVMGLGSAARMKMPNGVEKHPYELVSYETLYEVKVDGTSDRGAFFDMENGGKVRGAERKKEKFFLSIVGVDSAGQPRADDQIKMHFDESNWGDTGIYNKFLRLPPGILGKAPAQ